MNVFYLPANEVLSVQRETLFNHLNPTETIDMMSVYGS